MRVNITLPQDTLQLISSVAKNDNRSSFIDKAVRYYVEQVGKKNLEKKLKEGAIKRAERDSKIAQEWFNID